MKIDVGAKAPTPYKEERFESSAASGAGDGREPRNRQGNRDGAGARGRACGDFVSREQSGGAEYAASTADAGMRMLCGGGGCDGCRAVGEAGDVSGGEVWKAGRAGEQRGEFQLGHGGGNDCRRMAEGAGFEFAERVLHEQSGDRDNAPAAVGKNCEFGRRGSGARVRAGDDFGVRGGEGGSGGVFAFAGAGRGEERNYGKRSESAEY